MKNLATCGPREFFRQTNKIKKAAEKWLTATDILNIRKRQAEAVPISKDMDKTEARDVIESNIKARDSQVLDNLSAMFDAIFDEHPEETIELMALCCFVEPDDIDNHPMTEYLAAISDMLGNEAVIGFFTSLARWGVLNTRG